MPHEDNNFGDSLVLDFRKWWRHVQHKNRLSQVSKFYIKYFEILNYSYTWAKQVIPKKNSIRCCWSVPVLSLSRSFKGLLFSQGHYLEWDIAIILGTLGARIIIAALQYRALFYYLKLLADCWYAEIWNICSRSENIVVL